MRRDQSHFPRASRDTTMHNEPALDVLKDFIRMERRFHSSCGLHHKPCNMYCIDLECRGQPYCSLCKPHHHHSNLLIQIYNATRKKAALEQDIRALIDTSDIQKLINNGDTVLYLNSRGTLRDRNEPAEIPGKACKTCIYKFPPSVKDQHIGFCSINCKVECLLRSANCAAQNSDSLKTTPSQKREREVENTRKRPRKQLRPHRSPFM